MQVEKINNNSQVNNSSSQRRFLPFILAFLAGFLIVGGGLYYLYYVYKASSSQPPVSQTPAAAVMQLQPESATRAKDSSRTAPSQPASSQSATDLTGKWSGEYKIISPEACAGFSGPWTANITQSDNSFSGSYKSDLISGTVSGSSSATNNFNWIVTGNGIIQLKCNVTSPNAVSGNFTGPVCPGTSQKATGNFFGGR